jgi:hypothetical protein
MTIPSRCVYGVRFRLEHGMSFGSRGQRRLSAIDRVRMESGRFVLGEPDAVLTFLLFLRKLSTFLLFLAKTFHFPSNELANWINCVGTTNPTLGRRVLLNTLGHGYTNLSYRSAIVLVCSTVGSPKRSPSSTEHFILEKLKTTFWRVKEIYTKS